MKIIITGATGFVGKTLVPFLYGNGMNDLCLLIRDAEKARNLFGERNIQYINVLHPDWREQVIACNPDAVVHLATLFNTRCDAESAVEIIRSNLVFGTLLLEALAQTKCSYFINTGTFTEFLYGAGEYFANNLYSATKTAFRPIIQFYQTQSSWKCINVVIYSPYGRRNQQKKVLDFMVDAMHAAEPVNFTKGEQVLDFIHVDDIAGFFHTLLDRLPVFREPYTQLHLGTGQGHSIREVGAVMETVFQRKINACWGGLPYRKNETMYAVAPVAKNLERLGWKAKISLPQGLGILKEELSRPPVLS
ncbi:MAG: NAD(P)-dependent oxidoreductase [Dysgonamonadaceae bacterium]|jgi:CDP-paratose synthetase|nr:NAD(P)-dependent oxidoreductase [Dysgonamonadaceae bacterium]